MQPRRIPELDGVRGFAIFLDNCAAERKFEEEAMKLAGADHVEFLTGWFDQTVPKFRSEGQIDVLRLDGDWYDSTMTCLTYLFHQVRPGGLIIIDDYMQWDGCARAVHDYLSKKSAPERIQTRGGVSFIERIG